MRNVVVCLVMVVGFLIGSVQAQPSLAAGNANASPGTSVLVPVSITGGQSASAVEFTLQFDPTALTVSNKAPIRGEALTDHAVAVGRQAGRVTFVIFSGSLSTFKPGTSDLVSVIFEVNQGAADGSTVALELIEEEGAGPEGGFLSVVGVDGSIRIGSEGNSPTEGQNELIFPQVANGSFSGGKISVLLVLVNRTESTCSGEVRFFSSDGGPLSLRLRDGRQDSVFSFTIGPSGSAFLATDGSGELATGYARLSSTGPLGGILVFTTRDPAGNALTEAAVGSSPAGTRFSIPILLEQGGINTGIALANVSTEDAIFTLDLRDDTGNQLEQQTFLLGAGEHLPRFASELFDTLASTEDFQGSIEVNATETFSAVALKTQGSLLTTFPVVALP